MTLQESTELDRRIQVDHNSQVRHCVVLSERFVSVNPVCSEQTSSSIENNDSVGAASVRGANPYTTDDVGVTFERNSC